MERREFLQNTLALGAGLLPGMGLANAWVREFSLDADVVVCNPTHFSVAIKFDARTMDAPIVIAKGADYSAFQIREIAAELKIPVVRRPPLARKLFDEVEIGKPMFLPMEHWDTLVDVLHFAYALKYRDIFAEMNIRAKKKVSEEITSSEFIRHMIEELESKV